MMLNNDSIELIEENLSYLRTNAVIEKIVSISDKAWCISLRKCVISDSDFERIIRAMKKCKLVRYLNFNVNFINSYERASYLTTLLTSCKYLDTLCLHSSNIRDDGLKVISNALVNLKHFKSLDIGDCKLTDECVNHVREIVHRREHQNGLNELIISCNPGITPFGWAKILIGVAASADLQFLHMDYNVIDDSCGYLIIAILTSNHALEVLDLEHTGISNKTALLLLYLLKNYKLNIKNLNLLNNPIDKNIANQIKHLVKNEYDLNPKDNQFIEINESDYLPKYNTKTIEKKVNINPTAKKSNTEKQNHAKALYHHELELKIREQLKLEEFIKNAQKYNISRDADALEYQRALERDFLESRERYEKWLENDKFIREKLREKEEEEEAEILKPYDDFRFKTHSILPFNL